MLMSLSLLRPGGVSLAPFGRVRRELDEVFDRFFGPDNGGEASQWFAPQTNLAETEKDYEITLDLPGLKADQINLELTDGQLWITGERKKETEEKGKTFHRVERHYGQFKRVISLGPDVDAENVRAEYKDGVLRVTVPKVEAAQPKRIAVKS